MRRFRFRVGTLIITVALLAIYLAGFVTHWKSAEKRRLAQLTEYYRRRGCWTSGHWHRPPSNSKRSSLQRLTH